MTVQHKDIPDAQLHQVKGAATASLGELLVAQGDGTALFQNPGYSKTKMGWWDYNDTATATTPIALSVANTDYALTNNGLGSNTTNAYRLSTITNIWNTSTNFLQFTGMKVGDVVDMRIDYELVTSGANNQIVLSLELGIGGSSYILGIDNRLLKNAGTHKLITNASFYIGNTLTLNNLGRILIKNDSTGSTVKVNGFYIRAMTNG